MHFSDNVDYYFSDNRGYMIEKSVKSSTVTSQQELYLTVATRAVLRPGFHSHGTA
jgi:hypothetical protein